MTYVAGSVRRPLHSIRLREIREWPPAWQYNWLNLVSSCVDPVRIPILQSVWRATGAGGRDA